MKLQASAYMARMTIVVFALASSAAASQTPAQAPEATLEAASEPLEPTTFEAAPVTDAALQKIAGREDIHQTTQSNLVANSSGNKVGNDSVTGDVRISDAAFQNMSGLSLINFNTGNNVAMNAAMNVNIVINPPQP